MRCWTLLLAVLLVGCPKPHETDPPSPRPPYPIPDTELILAMCEHLKALGCEEGDDYYDQDEPGDAGVPNQTCEKGYARMQRDGYFVNPRCVMLAPSCDKIEQFRQREPDACPLPDAG